MTLTLAAQALCVRAQVVPADAKHQHSRVLRQEATWCF